MLPENTYLDGVNILRLLDTIVICSLQISKSCLTIFVQFLTA